MDEILDAAEVVFADVGYDAATTNLIARTAEVSPGTLYQYFDNKQAIATALAHRYVTLLSSTYDDVFDPALAALPLEVMVARAVDTVLAFHLAHPGAKVLLAGAQTSDGLAAAVGELHDRLCGGVETLISARAPQRQRADVVRNAEITISIYVGLLPSILAADDTERARLVHELKAAVTGYWASFDATGR